ncbi:MAG: DoxX family protein [Alphaproteobacteria bacterium]|uniref:DoxX family protein n=1 Tax=Brevundimonas sp. TaxID=1871086 RepID=UPI0017CB0987|nr:DoxX family protein [Brevundimonas sp.]MBA3051395.1 DoxX family protein [Brevundimonas sp.]MBU3974830.1 DoxX family protein [Alphaproteobacteria bacterium]
MKASPTVWTGRVLSGLFVLFMLGASIAPKFLMADMVAEQNMTPLGWPAKYLLLIGLIELTCVILYVVPRTSLLGAILMTGLLGGAIASNLRVENPLFSHTLFGVYLGLVMWGGLWLRDASLRAVFPVRRS